MAEPSLQAKFIMRLGDLIEDLAIRWLSLSPRVDILTRHAKVYAPQYDAVGTLDALARIGNQIVVVEVKSTRDKALDYAVPYPNHRLQAGAYAIFLSLPRAVLVYLGRDGNKKQSWIEVDQALKDEISGIWDTLNSYWQKIQYVLDFIPDNKEMEYAALLPDLPPRLTPVVRTYLRTGKWGNAGDIKVELNSECTRCPFQKLCWGETKSETEVIIKQDYPEVKAA